MSTTTATRGAPATLAEIAAAWGVSTLAAESWGRMGAQITHLPDGRLAVWEPGYDVPAEVRAVPPQAGGTAVPGRKGDGR